MKYGNTSRVLSFVGHALIFAAFGCLGLYFGFFVVPMYFNDATKSLFTDYLFEGAYNLYLELAIIGMALMSISLYGLIESVKGLLNPSDDKPVVKAFTAFIGDGYVLSAFFLLQGLLLFDLTGKNNLAFVIVMAILVAIILLIATNIPMVKLFDGKDQTPLVSGLLLSGSVTFFWGFVETFLTLIGSWANGVYTGSFWVNMQLMIGCFASLAIFVMTLIGAIVTIKKGASDHKAALVSGYLTAGSIFVASGILLSIGIIELVNFDTIMIHLESSTLKSDYGYGYGIMAIVLGSALLLASIYFAIVTGKEKATQTAKKA
jgi:hypothetical protein